MGTLTYSTKIQGRPVNIKLAKAAAEHVISEIKQALNIPGKHWIELTGIIGGEEHRSGLWSPFGGGEGTLADPERYAADCAALLDSLPELITKENAPQIVFRALALFDHHCPVVDKRETPEVHAQEAQERLDRIHEQEARRNEARLAAVSQYGESPEPVTIPEGYQPVTIQLHYDDSDISSDYFHDHCGHGEEFLLGCVREGTPRTERAHRQVIAAYPELASLTWKWDTENYSGGHGNWLQSLPVTELPEITTYGGHKSPVAWWEVSFGYGKSFLPFRGYAAAYTAPTKAPQTESASFDGYTLTHERDWSWVAFPSKPDPQVLDALRANGARWGKRRAAWYFTRRVEETELSALLGTPAQDEIIPEPEVSTPEPAPSPVSRFALGDD